MWERAGEQEEMKELFSQWQVCQAKEEDDNTRYRCDKDGGELWIAKESFSYDGAIVPEAFYSNPKRYIFLLPEGNKMADYCKEKGETPLKASEPCKFELKKSGQIKRYGRLDLNEDEFYFRDTGRYGRYGACLKKALNRENAKYPWNDVAYVNLNKRGGAGNCGAHVAAYVDKYWNCIYQQIGILANQGNANNKEVEIIICGWYLWNELAGEKITQLRRWGTIKRMFHPSARKKLEEFILWEPNDK